MDFSAILLVSAGSRREKLVDMYLFCFFIGYFLLVVVLVVDIAIAFNAQMCLAPSHSILRKIQPFQIHTVLKAFSGAN